MQGRAQHVLFVAKKMLVLGMPYLVCTSCYVAISSLLSSEMNPNTSYSFGALINIWKIPIAHYWYLHALMIMFIVIPAIELILKNVNKKYLFMAFILLALFGRSNISCINYIIQYAYLFYMGVIWNRFGDSKWKKYLLRHANYAWGGAYGIEGIMIYLIYVVIRKESILSTGVSVILQCAVTLLLVITMIRVSFVISENKTYIKAFLLWISKYSFYIYLFHTWFSGTCRVFLRKAGITNCWMQTFAGIIVGLIGPVLIAKVVKKVSIFLFWIEPLTIIRRSNQRISNHGEDEK